MHACTHESKAQDAQNAQEWLLLGPESRNPHHADAELPQLWLRRSVHTTLPLYMRAFLEGNMQLSAEDTAASKKLCAAASCPVLKSCTFAAETSEALATKSAEMEMRAG